MVRGSAAHRLGRLACGSALTPGNMDVQVCHMETPGSLTETISCTKMHCELETSTTRVSTPHLGAHPLLKQAARSLGAKSRSSPFKSQRRDSEDAEAVPLRLWTPALSCGSCAVTPAPSTAAVPPAGAAGAAGAAGWPGQGEEGAPNQI